MNSISSILSRKTAIFFITIFLLLIPLYNTTVISEETNIADNLSPPIAKGRILYVGGLGSGNYSSIFDAKVAAQDGDTIYVYNGTYYERLTIRKSIYIIGENKNTTIINASFLEDDVISINADHVTISGFTIINDLKYGWGIVILSDSNVIVNNILYDDILIGKTHGNIVRNNIIKTTYAGGIFANGITHSIISENKFKGNNKLRLYRQSNNNVITNNTFFNNGIYLSESYNNIISGNTINDNPIFYIENQSDGVIDDSYGQIILINCSNYTIKNIAMQKSLGISLLNTNDSLIKNIYITNCSSGISLEWSHYNIIENCRIINNSMGLILDKCHDNKIHFNIIKNISGNGISLYESQKNSISQNVISDNIVGIDIFSFLAVLTYFADGPLSSLFTCNNVISNNEISSNSEYGIFIGYSCLGNKIQGNNFIKNTCHASFEHLYAPMHNTWRRNYWDDHERYWPKTIKGTITSMYDTNNHRYVFIWLVFDLHPTKKPYDIDGSVDRYN